MFGVRPAEIIARPGQDRIPTAVSDFFRFLTNNGVFCVWF